MGETERAAEGRLARLLAGARPHLRDLATSPERPAGRLRRLAAAGARRLMFSVEHELHRQMVPLLGERVAPLVGEGA